MIEFRRRLMSFAKQESGGGDDDSPHDSLHIDMGLPSGTLWFKYNLGVDPSALTNAASYIGNYYAWGELTPKTQYTWNNYRFGTANSPTKYSNADGKTRLELEDDAAYVLSGGLLRYPTRSEMSELLQYSVYDYVEDYDGVSGLNGLVLISIMNDNTLFFPDCGYKTTTLNNSSSGYYHCADRGGEYGHIDNLNNTHNINWLFTGWEYLFPYSNSKYLGMPIRPVVIQKNHDPHITIHTIPPRRQH